jgi:hypothetical protein
MGSLRRAGRGVSLSGCRSSAHGRRLAGLAAVAGAGDDHLAVRPRRLSLASRPRHRILRSLDVRAAAEGVVVLAGYMPGYDGYGAIVAVQHREGYSTLYAHLSEPLVHSGQRVEVGEKIGIAGCTGWCTGTHLHFELRFQGLPVDPTLLIVG